MLAGIRNAMARASLRRATNVRTLADSAVTDALKQAGSPETGPLSSLPSSQVPVAAATSSIPRAVPPTAPETIHIPPAEDPLLHLFTSCIMKHGKRQEAARATSKMLLHIHAFTKAPPLPILRQAIVTAAPLLRCRQFKRAAKQFVFPMPLNERQRARQAIMWILEESEKRGGKHLPERAAREVIAVVKGDSKVIEFKTNVHKLAVLHRGNVLRPPRIPKSNKV